MHRGEITQAPQASWMQWKPGLQEETPAKMCITAVNPSLYSPQESLPPVGMMAGGP